MLEQGANLIGERVFSMAQFLTLLALPTSLLHHT